VKAAPSNIPNAGLGSFATHRLSKGSVITPVPLLHIPESSALDMFDLYVPEALPVRSIHCLQCRSILVLLTAFVFDTGSWTRLPGFGRAIPPPSLDSSS
jgi:hypothetical protein